MANSQELLECSICLDELKDPVTTSCGHSYCMKCINDAWDERQNTGYSCPQCRQTFDQRPDLKKTTVLAALLEERRTETSQSAAAAAGDTFAEPGDVKCDACTGRKRKASKFCHVCLASYCDSHLKPHFEVPPLKKHKLSEASARIQESICGLHNKLLEIYCRTDQQFICLQCVIDGHKDHDFVKIEAEKHDIQRKLDWTKQEIADRLLLLEGKKVELRRAAASIKDAALEECDAFTRFCSEHIRYVMRKCSEMRTTVGEAKKAGVDWTNSHLGKLRREEHELRRRKDQLRQLSLIEDQPIQFLKASRPLCDPPAFTDSHESLETVTEFVDAQKDNMKNMFKKAKNEIFSHSEENEYSKVEVDPNTVAACLCLSDTKKEISWGCQDQFHPDHPARFTYFPQALGKTGLNGSHYWEVECDGGIVGLAVSYVGIKRKGWGNDRCFGHNEISWKLTCSSSGCTIWPNYLHRGQIPPPLSRRVGVHLEFEKGTLTFYSVSDDDDMILLHQIQTIFTEPLYPGFSVESGATLKICNI
uniref:E3 ubiquitin/ISG15 ligase TRIM25-like n=1 Tax=Semicossyphus pulcher TaxID=241346 RepID=UPI0037E74CAF